MARPTWKGVISFGMVNIPVHLSPAVRSKDISFRTLHAKCKTPLREKRWCPVCDREVEQDEVARGYQYAKEKYIVLAEDELEDLPIASKHTIGLEAFVKEDEIDPIYYDKSYFLEPEENGLKGYALLLKALEERGLVAIAKIALQKKERLCALRPAAGALALDTLHYADEIREEDRPDPPKALVSKKELDVAFSFIGALTEDFDPAQYKDEYREAVLELIEAKLEDKDPKDVTREVEPKKATEGQDLLEALRASVAAVKGGKSAAKSGSTKTAARKASRTRARKTARAA
jgi:DNA end-binding protein Ku